MERNLFYGNNDDDYDNGDDDGEGDCNDYT